MWQPPRDDIGHAHKIAARLTDDNTGLKAARLHINASSFGVCCCLAEYVALRLPCEEYSRTATTVSFRFTQEVSIADVAIAMYQSPMGRYAGPSRMSSLCGVDPATKGKYPLRVQYHIDAAPPPPDYTPPVAAAAAAAKQ